MSWPRLPVRVGAGERAVRGMVSGGQEPEDRPLVLSVTHWMGCVVLKREDIPRGDLADRGRALDDPAVTRVAVGWAWEILGPPGARRRLSAVQVIGFVIDLITSSWPGINLKQDIFDGKPAYDTNPSVRGMAKRIEAANPVDCSAAAA